MKDVLRAHSHYETRARSYLRWYPATWRSRYGEEFVAHLEAEIEERPSSLARTMNIVSHAIGARFRLQPVLRWTSGLVASVALVVAVALGISSYMSVPPALAFASTNNSSMGLQTSPSTLNSYSFTFRAPAGEAIQIVGVKVVPVPGAAMPLIAGVDFTNRRVDLMNPGWPATFPPGTLSGKGPVHLVNALAAGVTLSRDNSLVVAFRTPAAHRLYALEGVMVTYVHAGHRYEFSLGNLATVATWCTVPQRGAFSSEWCDAKATAAQVTQNILHPSTIKPLATADQITAAWLYQNVAGFALERNHTMTLAQMRYFAAIVAPLTATTGIEKITLSSSAIFHIVFRTTQGSTSQICYQRALANTHKHYVAYFGRGSCRTASSRPTGPTING